MNKFKCLIKDNFSKKNSKISENEFIKLAEDAINNFPISGLLNCKILFNA